jgi:phosphate-selective porin
MIQDRPDNNALLARTTPDTFGIRQARLQMDGTFYKEFAFVVEADFPSQTATGVVSTVSLAKAFLEWKRWKAFQLRLGQFKMPISQERLNAILWNEMAEFSIHTRFTPGFEVGIQASGQLFDGLLGYEAAVSNGRGVKGQANGTTQGRVIGDHPHSESSAWIRWPA